MRFRTRELGLLLVAWMHLIGCKEKAQTVGSASEESGEEQVNPFDAIAQLAETGKEMQKKAKKLREQKPVDPVNYRSLVALMPQKPQWKSQEEPRGEMSQMGDFKISTSMQTYTRGNERMKVTLVDGSYVPMVYAPFTMMSKFSREGTDGHTKGLEISGQPAFEEWKNKSERITLTILVEDRFLITLEGNGVPPEEARAWAESFPIQRLSKWANEAMTGDDVLPPDARPHEEGEPEEKVARIESAEVAPAAAPNLEEGAAEKPAANAENR